jgi:hypothetical protein
MTWAVCGWQSSAQQQKQQQQRQCHQLKQHPTQPAAPAGNSMLLETAAAAAELLVPSIQLLLAIRCSCSRCVLCRRTFTMTGGRVCGTASRARAAHPTFPRRVSNPGTARLVRVTSSASSPNKHAWPWAALVLLCWRYDVAHEDHYACIHLDCISTFNHHRSDPLLQLEQLSQT